MLLGVVGPPCQSQMTKSHIYNLIRYRNVARTRGAPLFKFLHRKRSSGLLHFSKGVVTKRLMGRRKTKKGDSQWASKKRVSVIPTEHCDEGSHKTQNKRFHTYVRNDRNTGFVMPEWSDWGADKQKYWTNKYQLRKDSLTINHKEEKTINLNN